MMAALLIPAAIAAAAAVCALVGLGINALADARAHSRHRPGKRPHVPSPPIARRPPLSARLMGEPDDGYTHYLIHREGRK